VRGREKRSLQGGLSSNVWGNERGTESTINTNQIAGQVPRFQSIYLRNFKERI
jgi:hypothetical protein